MRSIQSLEIWEPRRSPLGDNKGGKDECWGRNVLSVVEVLDEK